eukprot:scaffold9342_cov63-Phaeocystis_antarctica.AAC.3
MPFGLTLTLTLTLTSGDHVRHAVWREEDEVLAALVGRRLGPRVAHHRAHRGDHHRLPAAAAREPLRLQLPRVRKGDGLLLTLLLRHGVLATCCVAAS